MGAVDQVAKQQKRDPLVGTVINGKFLVERPLAKGGMGQVYFGRQKPLDRPVALKIVKADRIAEEESQFLKRFLREASILAKLQHPNVVTLFDYGRIEEAPIEMYFIAMEFLDGETLTDRLRERGALETAEVLVLFRQIARGLREAHTRGIVHRDLKPSNIVIVPEADGEIVKLVDFGIGKVDANDVVAQDLTQEGILVGTPRYMAPEQFDGESSPASDIYALGTIVYQCLSGTLPFKGNTLSECMIAKLHHAIPAIRDVNPISDATERLESLVYGMLARHPDDRPSLEEVFTLLGDCEEEIFGTSGARLGTSGARPGLGLPASSRPVSVGALKVPYTIVAPAPISTNTGSGSISAVSPKPAAKKGVPLGVVIGLIVAILGLGGVGIWFAKARTPAQAPAEVATFFTLHLESNPTGAAVSEAGNVLGVTPLDVRIERASVGDHSRQFVLKKEGHLPVTLSQGASGSTLVEQSATLAPEQATTPTAVATPSAAPPPAAAKHPPGPRQQPQTPKVKPSEEPAEIRLKR